MKLFKYGITVFDCVENTRWNKFACRVSNIDYLEIALTKKFQVGYTPYYYDGHHYILGLGFISVCWGSGQIKGKTR